MVTRRSRSRRRRALDVDCLESRTLLSLLLNTRPTLDVVPVPHHVVRTPGGFVVVPPTALQVVGSAQPNLPGHNPNFGVRVEILAEDSEGNLLNNGDPLAVATPNSLGRYRVTVALPDVSPGTIQLYARMTASGVLASDLAIDATTLSGLAGRLTIDPTSLSNLRGNLRLNPGQLTGLTGRLSTPLGTLSDLRGVVRLNEETPAPITLGPGNIAVSSNDLSLSGTSSPEGPASLDLDGEISGSFTGDVTGSIDGDITGTIEGDIVGAIEGDLIGVLEAELTGELEGGFEGTIEAEQTGEFEGDLSGEGTVDLPDSTIDASGSFSASGSVSGITGTLGPSDGIFDQNGTEATIALPDATFTQTGSATESARTGTLQDGQGDIGGTTGSFTQTGTAQVAATTATMTTSVTEFAVSDPVTLRVTRPLPRFAGRPTETFWPRARPVGEARPALLRG